MKIVILGSRGLLGRALSRTLVGEVVTFDRASLDITDADAVRSQFAQLRPDLIVNAAGWTDVDGAEANPDLAHAANAEAVRNLAITCSEIDATLLHFSTDYVFGGDSTRQTPYRESDAPAPINTYGHSKLLGENIIREHCPKHFILRTCGLYGDESGTKGKRNFVDAILAKALRGEPLRVVADQFCTPTLVADLARAASQVTTARAYGLYHMTNAGACSWFEFAEEILRLRKIAAKISPVSTAEYAARACRPAYSVLDCDKWRESGFEPLRPWRDALGEHLEKYEPEA